VVWDTNVLTDFESTCDRIGLSRQRGGQLMEWFSMWSAEYAAREGRLPHTMIEQAFDVAKHRFGLTAAQEAALREWYGIKVRYAAQKEDR
jgi:hypothetical protein